MSNIIDIISLIFFRLFWQSGRGELLTDRGGGGHPAAPATQLREHPVPHKHHLCAPDTSGGHEQPARAALSETEGE